VVQLPLLAQTAAAWGLPLSTEQLEQFAVYAAELQRWNEAINLTSITDLEGISVRHFLDSLRCALSWGDSPDSLVDIGSGAGFPGLPLKLLHPSLQLTLIDSVAKKTAFLHHLVEHLGGKQVTILTMRAEDVGRDPLHRERYAVATSRAVAELRVLAEYCLPLVRTGGRFLAPKGADTENEVATAQPALAVLGGEITKIETVSLPDAEPRTLIVVTKVAPTPAAYPRRTGVPVKRPLS
jgi:16S rRNA (guanine527-N7)-methyltransferase